MKNKTVLIMGALILLLFGAGGCSANESDGRELPSSRVVLAYMGGDNNLTAEARQKCAMMALAMAGITDGKLVIYLDPADQPPQLLEVVVGSDGPETRIVESFEESDSADPDVLGAVIRRVVRDYPADSYGLFVFSHGSGWLPQGALYDPYNKPQSTRSIITDGRNEMELAGFSRALPDGLFDFIVFEACLMAGAEVAYELRDKTPYIVASAAEIVSPGFTHIYSEALPYLFSGAPDLQKFAATVFDQFASRSDYKSGTITVIKTAPLEELAMWLRREVDFSAGVEINTIQHFDSSSCRLFFDLLDYCAAIVDDEKTGLLEKLVDDCIVYKRATESFLLGIGGISGFAIDRHCGMTCYIEQENLDYLNGEYANTAWYNATRGKKDNLR